MDFDFNDYVVPFIISLAAAIFVAMGFALVKEGREWDAFKVAHKCEVVARIKGEVFNTFSSDGKVGVGVGSDKTGWKCDDGVTYFR